MRLRLLIYLLFATLSTAAFAQVADTTSLDAVLDKAIAEKKAPAFDESIYGLHLGDLTSEEQIRAAVGRQGTFKGSNVVRGMLGDTGNALKFSKIYYGGYTWLDAIFVLSDDGHLISLTLRNDTCNCADIRFEEAESYKVLKAKYDAKYGDGLETFDGEFSKFAINNGLSSQGTVWDLSTVSGRKAVIDLSNRKGHGNHRSFVLVLTL